MFGQMFQQPQQQQPQQYPPAQPCYFHQQFDWCWMYQQPAAPPPPQQPQPCQRQNQEFDDFRQMWAAMTGELEE